MNESQAVRRYCVRAGAVAAYHPANHTGTLKLRSLGAAIVVFFQPRHSMFLLRSGAHRIRRQ